MPEDLLRKYRPLGPPSDLRGRILVPERAAWPWAVAAAALLALTAGVHLHIGALAADAIGETSDLFSFDARVAALAETLGAGEAAHRRATVLALDEEIRMRLPPPPGMTMPMDLR